MDEKLLNSYLFRLDELIVEEDKIVRNYLVYSLVYMNLWSFYVELFLINPNFS